jgi:hypothetical protein
VILSSISINLRLETIVHRLISFRDRYAHNMDKVTTEIIKQIDEILSEWEDFFKVNLDRSGQYKKKTQETTASYLFTTTCDAIFRFAPPQSAYVSDAKTIIDLVKGDLKSIGHGRFSDYEHLIGILEAIKNAYIKGYLIHISELINAELFSDFIEMADYYLQAGHKDAAAVILGGVLEEHLRKLCKKNNIPFSHQNAQNVSIPTKSDTLNSDLAKASVYSAGYQKQIIAWLDIRNNAAHGHYTTYSKEQIQNMIDGLRSFVNLYPA